MYDTAQDLVLDHVFPRLDGLVADIGCVRRLWRPSTSTVRRAKGF